MKKTINLAKRLVIIAVVSISILNCSISPIAIGHTYINLHAFQLKKQATHAYHEQDYKRAVHFYEQALEQDREDEIVAYNLACSYALQGDAENAAIYVVLAFENGFRNMAHFHSDPDFNSVRDNNDFKKTVRIISRKTKFQGTSA